MFCWFYGLFVLFRVFDLMYYLLAQFCSFYIIGVVLFLLLCHIVCRFYVSLVLCCWASISFVMFCFVECMFQWCWFMFDLSCFLELIFPVCCSVDITFHWYCFVDCIVHWCILLIWCSIGAELMSLCFIGVVLLICFHLWYHVLLILYFFCIA